MGAPSRIHILGASGSGTTTLGAALAARIGGAHLDTDDFYWSPTDPPYQTARPVSERLALLRAAIEAADRWTLSGSQMGWGDPLIPRFEVVAFVYTPPDVRIRRLLQRERLRYGRDIEPGGRMHAHSLDFIEWARGYDRDDFDGRSLSRHRAWLAALPCPVIEIDGRAPVATSVETVVAFAS